MRLCRMVILFVENSGKKGDYYINTHFTILLYWYEHIFFLKLEYIGVDVVWEDSNTSNLG